MLPQYAQKKILTINPAELSAAKELLLDEQGYLRLLSNKDLSHISHDTLTAFMVRYALYVLPTTDLIHMLDALIGGLAAIEICAGNDRIGHWLKIPMTDSYQQTTPDIKLFMAMIMQEPTDPKPDVIKMDALTAVEHFKPQVVVGSFVTQLFQVGDSEKKIGSNVNGVDEMTLIQKIHTYICIGNTHTHRDKRAYDLPHKRYDVGAHIITRAFNQDMNAIWVW